MGCCTDKEQQSQQQLHHLFNPSFKNKNITNSAKLKKDGSLSPSSCQTKICQQQNKELLNSNGCGIMPSVDQEDIESDMLRVTHINNNHLNIDNALKRRAEGIKLVQTHQSQNREKSQINLGRTSLKFTYLSQLSFGPLSTIREEESSMHETNLVNSLKYSLTSPNQSEQKSLIQKESL